MTTLTLFLCLLCVVACYVAMVKMKRRWNRWRHIHWELARGDSWTATAYIIVDPDGRRYWADENWNIIAEECE